MIRAWCNGEASTGFALDTRAAHYGDGAFTTLRVHDGAVCWWGAHLARLQAACAALHLQPPDWLAMHALLQREAAVVHSAVIKVLLVPKASGRGYVRQWPSPVDWYVFVNSPVAIAPATYRTGIELTDARHTWLAGEPDGIKTLSCLAQVLAATATSNSEVLICDRYGFVGCARSANVFAQFGDVLVTPPAGHGVVAGVARASLLQSPPTGFSVRVQAMHRDALRHADAVILSNAVRGFVPVVRYAGQGYVRRDAVRAIGAQFHPLLGLPVEA